jgi:hypothetical protein
MLRRRDQAFDKYIRMISIQDMKRKSSTVCGFVMLIGGASLCAENPVAEAGNYYDEIYKYELPTEAPVDSDLFEQQLSYETQAGVFSLYGQINLAYQSFDDGGQVTDGIVDNGNWNTRLGFLVYKPLGEITLRARFESGLGLRNSALVSQESTPDWINWDRIWLRWFEVAVDSRFGTISAGQGSSASDGTAGLDDSFTFHAGATDSSDGFGAFRFRDTDGNLTDVNVGRVNDSFDGARRFRVRYDTPDYHGFTLASSYGINVLTSGDDNDYYDVALRWVGELGDVAVRSAVGYQWVDRPDAPNSERVAGSVAAVHKPTGLNLAVSSGKQIDGASYYWTRLGWRFDVFDFGTTSVSADYYNGSDFITDGARSENHGLYLVQTIDGASVDLYAGWRRFTYGDRTGTSYQDADGFLVGCRFAF